MKKLRNWHPNITKNCLDCQITKHTDKTELETLFNFLNLAGVNKSNHEDIRGLFASDGTGDIFSLNYDKKEVYIFTSFFAF